MIVYLINILSIFIWLFFFCCCRIKNPDKKVLVIVMIQLLIIAGFRNLDIGTDTKNYISIYESIKSLQLNEVFNYYLEFGYVLINKIVHIINDNYTFLLLLNSLIILLGVYKFIQKYSSDKVLSLFLFLSLGYFSSMMNIMRQYIALVFVLLAYHSYLKNKSLFKSFLIIIFASFFHKTAIYVIFVIILYSIYSSNNFKKNSFLRTAMLISVGFFCIIMPTVFEKTIGSSDFYGYMVNGAGFSTSLVSFSFLFKITASLFCFYVKKNKLVLLNHKQRIEFFNYLNIISCFINLLSVKFSMFTRLNMYFSFSLIIFIPLLIDGVRMEKKLKKFLKLLLYCVFFILYLSSLISNDNMVVPYEFYGK